MVHYFSMHVLGFLILRVLGHLRIYTEGGRNAFEMEA